MQIADSRPWSCLALICCFQSACIVDTMPPDIYASAGHPDAGNGPHEKPPEGFDDDAPDGSDAEPDSENDASTPDGGSDVGHKPPAPGCDLTGPWLITERLIATGLGAKQAAVWWLYYEFDQSAEQLKVKKGLVCGTMVKPIGPVSASVDMHTSWPKILELNPHASRTGSSKPVQAGCNISLSRMPYVMGASMPYYRDKSRALPMLDQAASESNPGWEDWDSDGNPGISLHVSGLANGIRYTATRTFSDWSGTIKGDAKVFKLRSTWSQDEAVFGATSDVLKQTGTRDGDPTLHFAQFAKLNVGQVSGDDSAVCKQIRELAPMLTAEANQ